MKNTAKRAAPEKLSRRGTGLCNASAVSVPSITTGSPISHDLGSPGLMPAQTSASMAAQSRASRAVRFRGAAEGFSM